MNIKKFLIYILTGLLFISTACALTASIGNARMILKTNITPENPSIIERSILVNNVNNIAVNVELVKKGAIAEFIEIEDTKFTLEPNESKKAGFRITATKPGYFEGEISVGFSPLDPESGDSPVGLQSKIILNVIGTGFPENFEGNNTATGKNESRNVTITFGKKPKADNNTNQTGYVKDQPYDEPKKAASITPGKIRALIGLGIIIVIVAIGLVSYFFLSGRR